jgi:hypothetical protein
MSVAIISDGEALFPPNSEQRDLVHMGICQLERVIGDNALNEYRWRLSELLAQHVCLAICANRDGKESTQTVLSMATHSMYEILFKFGEKTTNKGDFGEQLVFAQMLQPHWQGKLFAHLDVVKDNVPKETIPSWMNKLRFRMVRFGTAKQLGFQHDMEFLEALAQGDPRTKDVLLQPEKAMRPDGLLLFKQYLKKDANGLVDESEFLEEVPDGPHIVCWFAVTVGSKIYSNALEEKTHTQNELSTEILKVYYKKDGTGVNSSYLEAQQHFHTLFHDFRGTLRIHLELPYAAAGRGISFPNQTGIAIHINGANLATLISDTEARDALKLAAGSLEK